MENIAKRMNTSNDNKGNLDTTKKNITRKEWHHSTMKSATYGQNIEQGS